MYGDPGYDEICIGEIESLYSTANDEITIGKEYAKYWHGYILILRPLLMYFNYGQIRIIQLVVLNILAIVVTIFLIKKVGKLEALLLVLSLFAINFERLFYTMEFSIMFYIMFFGMIYILINYEKMKNFNKFACIMGIVTCFFDFLTTPILSFIMPITVYFMLKNKTEELELKKNTKLIVKAVTIWLISYGMMWFAKFILVDLFYDRELLKKGVQQILHRTIGIYEDVKYGMFWGIKNSFSEINYLFIIIPIVIMILICIFKSNFEKIIKINIKKVYPFIILSVIPLVWIFCLNEHDWKHSYFTYRTLLGFIFNNFIFLSIVIKDNCLKNK